MSPGARLVSPLSGTFADPARVLTRAAAPFHALAIGLFRMAAPMADEGDFLRWLCTAAGPIFLTMRTFRRALVRLDTRAESRASQLRGGGGALRGTQGVGAGGRAEGGGVGRKSKNKYLRISPRMGRDTNQCCCACSSCLRVLALGYLFFLPDNG